VSISDLTSRDAVLAALDEFDRIGRAAFLEKYGFGPSRAYFVKRGRELYDSKAVVGAAVAYEDPKRGPMRNAEFSGGEATVKAKLEELGFEVTRQPATKTGAGLVLPQTEVDAFAAHLDTPEYAEEERDYKLVVHYVLRSLFSPDRIASAEFPAMLGAFFERKLDPAQLNLPGEDIDLVKQTHGSPQAITNAFINLCGGGYGVNNFVWIPGAIRDGLGEPIRETFADLLASDEPLAERVDRFRTELVAVEERAEQLPSWHENWKIVAPSLSFVAALLAGIDPQRFTFYHQGKLRAAHESLVGEWPKGTIGEVYTEVVGFVGDVRDALARQGAPVRDLIDAQSFLYMRDSATSPESTHTERDKGPDETLHLVVKWSATEEPRTVELHRDAAEEHGAVWWGLIGREGRRKLSESSLKSIQAQLDAGTQTTVFLSGPPSAPGWRAQLVAIQESRPGSEEELIPNYYPPQHHHSLWVKISNLQEVERDWLMRHLEPAANSGKLVALGNQTNPLLVRIRARPRVWWVNQGGSYRRARDGGHIWAPERNKAGTELAHWSAMRYLRQGDRVLHYANTEIRALGRVVSEATRSGRPDEVADQAWGDTGFRAEVEYRELDPRIRLIDIPEEWRLKEGAPFNSAGSVQQGYLFALSDSFLKQLKQRFSQLDLDVTGIDVEPPQPPSGSPAQFDLKTLRSAGVDRGLRLEDGVYANVIAALESGKHVIFTGPPGTAKTTLAEVVAATAARADRCNGHLLTTATADWTTYETIGGLRPTEDGLAFSEGHFLEAIRANQWLVIDELNRSNFDRAFGQLFTVLSGQTVVLPYERTGGRGRLALVPHGASIPSGQVDALHVPETWRVIATMNVFDKTLLFEMSFALMRRFAFVEVPSPPEDVFVALIEEAAEGDTQAADVAKSFLSLRKFRDLGPALFMDVARFVRARRELGGADDRQLAFQSFYSFLLPQFEGIDEEDGEKLFAEGRRAVGAAHRERLRRTLNSVLGLQLAEKDQADQEEDIDFAPDEPDLLSDGEVQETV
jgi:MoxR-like ATPase